MSSLDAEMWAWYALTLVVVVARMASRRMLLGSFKRMLADDYLMAVTMVTYTALLAIVSVLTRTPTNLINPDDHIVLTPEDIKLREYGSKLVLVTEHMQMITLWGVKGCLLFMYGRLTMSLKQNFLVKLVAGYVVVGFVVMQILWFAAWCRPFNHYWQVPPDDSETNHMITNTVVNISSDIMIILLPMPVFLQSQLPLKRKIILCGVFALGIFTILAATMSKIYSLGDPFGTEWSYWYIREVSTAVIAANLPLTWTLLQRVFRLGSFHAKYGKSSNQRTGEGTSRFRSAYGNLSSMDRRPKKTTFVEPGMSFSESQEEINGKDIPLKIYQKNEVIVNITTEEASSDKRSPSPPGHTGLERINLREANAHGGSENGDKSANEMELGVVTKVYHGMLALSWASYTAFLKDIVECTAAVVFLGTPHRGSPDLSAIGEWARSILDTFHFQTNPAILDALGLKTTDLERAHEAFSRLWLQYDFRVKTFQEGFGLAGIKLGVLGNKVVPHDSSLIGDPREHAETLQANHTEMSRFRDATDPNFLKVAGEIKEIYTAIEREQMPRHVQTRNFRLTSEERPSAQYGWRDQQKVIDKKILSTLIQSLRFDGMNTRRECISFPMMNTGQWLFQNPTFRTWQTSRHFSERLLFIKGKPGAGKSTLMKEAVRRTKSGFQGHGCCASFFINTRGDSLECSPSGILRSLLCQLLTYCEDLRINLESEEAIMFMRNIREKAAMPLKEWPDRQLESFLTDILELLSREQAPAYIFVDALDELGVGAERHVVTFWKNLVQSQVSPNTRVCLSCRHFPNISTEGCLELALDAHNNPDILTYINLRLKSHIKMEEHRWRAELSEKIFSMSTGVFLWVVLVIDAVCTKYDQGYSLRALISLVKDTPTELKEVYAQTISTLTDSERVLALKLFQWVTGAARPLRLDEWHHVLAFIAARPPKSLKAWRESLAFTGNDHQLERMIKTLSRGLLEISNSQSDIVASKEAVTSSVNAGAGSLDHEQGSARVVQLIHESVYDFLMLQGGFELLGWTGTSIIADCHCMIAITCLNYMNIPELDDLVLARQLNMTGDVVASSKPSSFLGEHQDLRTREDSFRPERTLDGLNSLPRIDPQKLVETWVWNEHLASSSSSLRDAANKSAASGSTRVESQALKHYPALLLYAASELDYHIHLAGSATSERMKAKIQGPLKDGEFRKRLAALHVKTRLLKYREDAETNDDLSSKSSAIQREQIEVLKAQMKAKRDEKGEAQGPRRPRSIASFGSASSYGHRSSISQNG
ncbi:hypothetical protein BFJ72_g10946 [Fusarium proliferatum]|uniref:Uncharacterized protein n=1 Tax=Gibberella intermedia TaxID=948311 RepID=A0A420SQH5_GIBIN|nr:hypothetical protein BFJ72_g10946 [Fusarium proliferatum]